VGGNLGQPVAMASTSSILYREAKKDVLDIFAKDYLTRLFKDTRGNISETSRISGLKRAPFRVPERSLNGVFAMAKLVPVIPMPASKKLGRSSCLSTLKKDKNLLFER
jgi:hypothetical protein